MIQPTLVLQRLDDPTRQHSNPADDPNSQDPRNPATYNPWITVDFSRKHLRQPRCQRHQHRHPRPERREPAARRSLNKFASVGRKQPLKASARSPARHHTRRRPPKAPTPAPTDHQTPLNTFARHNSRNAADTSATITIPFDWYIHLDRPLLNRGELMNISTTSPALLTHKNSAPGWTLGEAYGLFKLGALMSRKKRTPRRRRSPGTSARAS